MKFPDRVNEADKKAYFKCEWHHSIGRHPGLKEKKKVNWALPFISLLPDWMWCAPPPSPASVTPFTWCPAPLYRSNSALPTQVVFYFVTATKGVTQVPCTQRIPPPGVPRGRKSAVACNFFFFPRVQVCVCVFHLRGHTCIHIWRSEADDRMSPSIVLPLDSLRQSPLVKLKAHHYGWSQEPALPGGGPCFFILCLESQTGPHAYPACP